MRDMLPQIVAQYAATGEGDEKPSFRAEYRYDDYHEQDVGTVYFGDEKVLMFASRLETERFLAAVSPVYHPLRDKPETGINGKPNPA